MTAIEMVLGESASGTFLIGVRLGTSAGFSNPIRRTLIGCTSYPWIMRHPAPAAIYL